MGEPLVILRPEQLRELVRDAVADALEASRPADETPALLDRAGLAKALHCSLPTVDRLRSEGLPTFMLGDSPRFGLAKVLAWLELRSGPATQAGPDTAEPAEKKPNPLASRPGSYIAIPASARKSAKTKESANGAATEPRGPDA